MPISRSFYFIRHGQTDWNVERRLQGQMDIPLNETGREQARASIPYFKSLAIDIIVSSPLKRAHETAEIISQTLKLPIKTHDGLKERHYIFYCHSMVEAEKKYKGNSKKLHEVELYDSSHVIDAEDYCDYQMRLFEVIDQSLNMHKGKEVLFVGHTLSPLITHPLFLDKAIELDMINADNAVPYHFQKNDDGSWNIEKVTL